MIEMLDEEDKLTGTVRNREKLRSAVFFEWMISHGEVVKRVDWAVNNILIMLNSDKRVLDHDSVQPTGSLILVKLREV